MEKETQSTLFQFDEGHCSTAVSKVPLGGKSCLKPDYWVLCFALYGAGKTSFGQCLSIIQYLLSYRKWRSFLLRICTWLSRPTSCFSLCPDQYPRIISHTRKCHCDGIGTHLGLSPDSRSFYKWSGQNLGWARVTSPAVSHCTVPWWQPVDLGHWSILQLLLKEGDCGRCDINPEYIRLTALCALKVEGRL